MGEHSTANRVEAIGQPLYNQVVLILVERMSINMSVVTLAYRAQCKIKTRFFRLYVMFVFLSALCQLI